MTEEPTSESKPTVKVSELTPNSKEVNVIVKVANKGQTRDVTSGRDYSIHKVADALVGDETGSVYLTLWDDNVTKVNEGDTISIKNGYINLFRGSMRLNIGRHGTLEPAAESPIGEVNTENNLSSKQYEQERRYPPRREGGGYGGGGGGGYGDRRGGGGYGRGRGGGGGYRRDRR